MNISEQKPYSNYTKLLSLLFVFILLAGSCKKNKIENPDPVPPPVQKPTKTESSKTVKIDSIRNVMNAKKEINILSDSVWADSLGISFKIEDKDKDYRYGFSSTFKDELYAGSLISLSSLNTGTGQVITEGYRAEKANYYFSNPWNLKTFESSMAPSLTNTKQFITDIYKNASPRKQVEESNGARTEFSDYNLIKQQYLKLIAEADLAKNMEFSDASIKYNGRLHKKTGFLIFISTINHNLIIDKTALNYNQIYFTNNGAAFANDIAVLNSISYGRFALLTLESDNSYAEISSAYAATLAGNPSAEQKQILESAISGIYLKGNIPALEKKVSANRGYEKVKAFQDVLTNGSDDMALGAPLFFQAETLKQGDRIGHPIKYQIHVGLKITKP